MTPNVHDLDNIWTSDKKCLSILPPASHYSNVTPTGFQSALPSNVRYYVHATLIGRKVLPGTDGPIKH